MSDLTEIPDPARLLAAVETVLAAAPRDRWRYVPCGTCNAGRGEGCMAWDGPARGGPHAARRRAGSALASTLWLLAHHPADILGADWTEDA